MITGYRQGLPVAWYFLLAMPLQSNIKLIVELGLLLAIKIDQLIDLAADQPVEVSIRQLGSAAAVENSKAQQDSCYSK